MDISRTPIQQTRKSGSARERRDKKRLVRKLLEQSAERSWQERFDWLSRPRLHTATISRDEELAKECAKYDAVIIEREPTKQRRAEREKEIEKLGNDLGWSAERLTSFKEIVVQYQREPSIENYVRVRRLFPEVEIQVARFGGLDPLTRVGPEPGGD